MFDCFAKNCNVCSSNKILFVFCSEANDVSNTICKNLMIEAGVIFKFLLRFLGKATKKLFFSILKESIKS